MVKNQVQFLVDELNKPTDKLVVLMTSTHELTDGNIAKTGHEFYNLDIAQFPIKWPANHPVPSNMKVIKSLDELPYRPDVILSQNIIDQYNVFKQISFSLDCPIIQFEHTVPTDVWKNTGVLNRLLKEAKPELYGFITEFSRKEWLRGEDKNAFSVLHMIDFNYFKPKQEIVKTKTAMILANAFFTRTWALGNIHHLLEKAHNRGIEVNLFGHNQGFKSMPLGKDQVVQELNSHKIFINTSLRSPLPASLLEAAACGSVILSTKTCAIPEYFDESSIIWYNNYDECLDKVKEISDNYDKYKYLGENARKVILDKFNEKRYVDEWNAIFKLAINKYNEN